MSIILSAKNLCKSFGSGEAKTQALNDVSLDVAAGDFVAIMGPSGSGKSTLLFALAAMDTIDSGSVHFQGQSLHDSDPDQIADLRRQSMGFVFQDATMLANLDLLDNILLPQYDAAKPHQAALVDKAKRLMDKLGLAGLENRQITEVSGGQLQRAAIARAILHEPSILFGDEPTGALNSQATDEILALFSQLNANGTTILLVTHDPKVAAQAKRVVFMRDGQLASSLVLEGQPPEQRQALLSQEMLALGV